MTKTLNNVLNRKVDKTSINFKYRSNSSTYKALWLKCQFSLSVATYALIIYVFGKFSKLCWFHSVSNVGILYIRIIRLKSSRRILFFRTISRRILNKKCLQFITTEEFFVVHNPQESIFINRKESIFWCWQQDDQSLAM